MNRSSLGVSNESFVLLSRLSTTLRRQGRLLDLVWFQHNPAYAEAVLALVEQYGSADLTDLVWRLRASLSVQRDSASRQPDACLSAAAA